MLTAKKHAKLAFVYADDGAFGTAAKILHETAELFEAERLRLNAILNPKENA